jgi:hypothetical protein
MKCNLDTLDSNICKKLYKCTERDLKVDRSKIESKEDGDGDSNIFSYLLFFFLCGATFILYFQSPKHGERLFHKLIDAVVSKRSQ